MRWFSARLHSRNVRSIGTQAPSRQRRHCVPEQGPATILFSSLSSLLIRLVDDDDGDDDEVRPSRNRTHKRRLPYSKTRTLRDRPIHERDLIFRVLYTRTRLRGS